MRENRRCDKLGDSLWRENEPGPGAVMPGLIASRLVIFGMVIMRVLATRCQILAARYGRVFMSSETECANFRIRFQSKITARTNDEGAVQEVFVDVEVLGDVGFGRFGKWIVFSARCGQRIWLVVLGLGVFGRGLFRKTRVTTAVFERTKQDKSRRGAEVAERFASKAEKTF